jgi:hypothetical protein
MSTKKSAIEKLKNSKQPEVKILTFNFAGIKSGEKMLVSSPKEIAEYIKKIPSGKTKTMEEMKADLAKKHSANKACPVSTPIFLRVVSEAALEEIDSGKSQNDVTPFWRVVDPESKIATKIPLGADFIKKMRESESLKSV